MSLQVEKLENNQAKLTVTCPAEEVEKALQAAYIKERGKIALPGFRKGKVPRQMIEKMYGPEVFYDEAANTLINGSYGDAYDESELEIVSQPTIDIVQLEKGKEFIYTAEVALKPEVTLGDYKGLSYAPFDVEVSDEEVEGELNKELEKNSRNVEVTDRAVQDQDIIKLNFEGFVEGKAFEGGKGEDYPLTIGSGSFIPGFEEQLIGAVIGDNKDVHVTFPEDYQATDLAGKEALFVCKVLEIKEKEVPELDDDFASDVSEFETLDEYKADLRAKLQENKDARAKEDKENQVVDKAIENATMELPQAMVDMEVKQMTNDFASRLQQQGLNVEQYFQFSGMNQEKMLAEMTPQAEKRIKTRLLLEAIAKAENIQISDERVDEEMQKMADQYQMEIDKIKEFMGEKEVERMKQDLAVQDAITLIADTAVEA